MTTSSSSLAVDVQARTVACELKEKIRNTTARVGEVGLGYVGLPLAVEFAQRGFTVTGIEVQRSRADTINAGVSYIQDVATSALQTLVAQGLLKATDDFAIVSELDTINICVPTPLRKTKDPDMSYIVSACERIVRLSRGSGMPEIGRCRLWRLQLDAKSPGKFRVFRDRYRCGTGQGQ